MAFTYSFAAIINTVPFVRIPYQDSPDTEGRHYMHLHNQNADAATALFRSECTKNVIILDCVNAKHSHPTKGGQSPVSPDPDHIEACYSRLKSWWLARPLSLRPEQSPSKENLLFAYVHTYSSTRQD